ncbi:MAG: glucose-6-phosphate dehydrogenase [Gaiellaceae bacterium]
MAAVAQLNPRPRAPAPRRAELEDAGLHRRPDPCLLAIFGASGDLTRRKLLPALYALAFRRLLPERFAILGVARADLRSDEWRSQMRDAVREHARDPFDRGLWDELARGMQFVCADFGELDDRGDVEEALVRLERERWTQGNRLHYLAVPPSLLDDLAVHLGKHGRGPGWTRVVVEKPFGHDLTSARTLNQLLHRHFRESEIFRIDHYLGKETVQNLLVLRFANGIFEPLWNRQLVDHVQITVAEAIGIEGRAAYYEQAGAIRDMFQNHLLQLLALVAMEPPIDLSADQVRIEKLKVLRAMRLPGSKQVVRGQYGGGSVEGRVVPGYREEPEVDPNSMTETYVATKLFIHNWRWADTPFYVRTGKRLARRQTAITVQFKRAPHTPFRSLPEDQLRPNALIVRVEPDEGISLEMTAKVPGQGLRIQPVRMDFFYGGVFGGSLPEAYERLILDAMLGDGTLFTGADEVEEQWLLVDAIVARWRYGRPAFPNYAAGSWGPPAADELLRRDGRSWRNA